MDTKIQINHPVAVFIRGLPGGGKSAIAQALVNSLGTKHTVLLNPDVIDYKSQAYADHIKDMQAEGVDEKLYPYRFLRAKAYKAIEENKIIVWDQPFRNLEMFNKMVGRLKDHAAKCATTIKILVVEVEIDEAVARQRVQLRKQQGGHGPTDFDSFIAEHKSFEGQGFNIVKVNGQDNIDVSVSAILDALQPLSV